MVTATVPASATIQGLGSAPLSLQAHALHAVKTHTSGETAPTSVQQIIQRADVRQKMRIQMY